MADCVVCGRQIALYAYADILTRHGPNYDLCKGSFTRQFSNRVAYVDWQIRRKGKQYSKARKITKDELIEHAVVPRNEDGSGQRKRWQYRWEKLTGNRPLEVDDD